MRMLLEVEAEKMRYIPHLLNFKCGARALLTLYGRPSPLCQRCHTVGHIRMDCPGQFTVA
ncbi:hypothetical protein DPMN_136870 [Dreissena polymorpha]|uniref:CCHC-type domain-containing protein n=1 Tax=Dreissena polymorpha TaxID=45954 RepID=A0A9D4G3N3_DREPO|nr:hypothetical protein DPMN_136870 [Dreissena polymorpha]